jgi:NADH:ubiquinone oxidoreductase subunit B-like Fe-S oxidoreductase
MKVWHSDIFLACCKVNELVDYTKEKYASRGNGITKPVYPDIVVITDDNTRTMLYLIESLFDHIADPRQDKLDWIRGQSKILWQSDNFN